MQGLPSAVFSDERTLLAHRKLAFRTLLMAFSLFVNAAKGLSSLQLSRTWAFMPKLRSSYFTSYDAL